MYWPSREESKRIRQIVRVLFNHHLGNVAAKLSISKIIPLAERMQTHRFKKRTVAPVEVRRIFEDLGGSFLKLGQLMSLRPDLIPIEYCDELAKLQDAVPPVPGKVAKEIVSRELGKSIGRIFKSFDDAPIASASIGQVHKAVLKNGKRVAVKVQRPGVRETVHTDIKLLNRFARIWRKKHPKSLFNPVEVVQEFERYTLRELDYRIESRQIQKFHANFKNSKTLHVPAIYQEYTTSDVLVMEYIAGSRLSGVRKLTQQQKKKIISTILDSEWEQIFVNGYFHGDPHPGNFLLKKNGKLALLDFGIVGRLEKELKEDVADLFVSLVNADVDGLVESAVRMGVADERVDRNALRQDLRDNLGLFYGQRLENIKISKIFGNMMSIFRRNRLKVPADFVLLTKAAVTLEGFAKEFDPKLNFIEHAKPFVKKLMREKLNPKNIAREIRRKALNMAEFAESIPRRTTQLLSEIDDTHHDLKHINHSVHSLANKIDASSNRLTLGFMAGTILIAATFLLPYEKTLLFGVPALSFCGYILALIIICFIFFSMIKERKL